jgi:hypothetical protein
MLQEKIDLSAFIVQLLEAGLDGFGGGPTRAVAEGVGRAVA